MPMLVWFAGTGAAHSDDTMTLLLDKMRKVLPVGGRAVVLIAETRPGESTDLQVSVPNTGGGPAPAAVTFETSDKGLYSLDWIGGDTAETYLGVDTLDAGLAG